MNGPLIVLGTDVVIRALIGGEDSASYRVVRAVGTAEVRLLIGDEFLRELSEVVGYPKVESRVSGAARAFRTALDIGVMGEHRYPKRLDWPSVPDPEDYWMPDLAWRAEAELIVTWDRHLLDANLPFPVEVLRPPAFLARLR